MKRKDFDIVDYISSSEPDLHDLLKDLSKTFKESSEELQDIDDTILTTIAIAFGSIGAFSVITAYESCDLNLSKSVNGIIGSILESSSIQDAFRTHQNILKDKVNHEAEF